MSIKMRTYFYARHFATASALSLLLATPALAQSASSESNTQAQQADASTATQAGTSNREHARNIEGAYENVDFSVGGNRNNADQPTQDQTIIERSFSDEVEPDSVSQLEAGTTEQPQRADTPDPSSAVGLSGTVNTDAQSEQNEELRNVPEGTGVIAVDGKVIARTESENGNDAMANEPQASEQQQADASSENSSEQPAASDTQDENSRQSESMAAGESGNLQRLFEQLQDATVINSTGEEIGTVTGVVLDNDSGESGLVVQTSETGQNTEYLLAPVAELSVNDAEVRWGTEASVEDLRQSATYNPQIRDEVSASQADEAEEGISQR